MGEIINPYIAGAPVTEQRMFFGREDIFQWVENSITGQYADHILVIHGQRRVGKTSVLKQLGNRLPSHYIPVFFDLQGRTHTTLDRFLWWLAREIVRTLKQERDIDLPIPEKEDFSKDLEYFENRFLPDLQPVLNRKTLLLTFDEFDNLEESEIKEELARPLVDHLRRLMGHPHLNFIFSIGSSGRKLENMQAEYTDFFKAALYKKISFLNEEQTHHLITRPVEGVLKYDKDAVGRIYNIASGHPYFTQLTCHELFARCQRTEQRQIAVEDVEAVLDDVVERGTVNLKFVWDEASDIEKWSLAGLACMDKADSRALADYLRKNRVRFSESDLTSGLLHLREKDVLASDNRFVIQLLKRWLQKNRPIEQVREELTEVNPIANRYIEIGLEFKDSGFYDKAINSFQEALTISKENIQAQVNIALIYMDQKIYDKAIIEFEKALTFDDEDVSARSGLCEAHLALGDAAMAKGRSKEAVTSYQRVLAINAEHTEARQRMADLGRRRAEEFMLNGREDEVLDALKEALKYTPEDKALNARVEKLQAQKKAKRFADLISKSEKEAQVRNWSGVIRSLEEALVLSPEDEGIPKKIEEAKSAQEKAQVLADIYAEAQKAYSEKNYDTAVSLFKKIVLEDENYRDASRLLAQAIELRRTAPKWWQGKTASTAERTPLPRRGLKIPNNRVWAFAVVSILVMVIVGGLFWVGNDILTLIPATAVGKTGTSTEIASPTPELALDIQIALAAIQNEEPLYQTDFNDWDSEDTDPNAALVNGKLMLTSEDENGVHFALNAYSSDRYVVEFEIGIPASNGVCFYGAGNGAPIGESFRGFTMEFLPGEDSAVLARYVPESGLDVRLAATSFDKTRSNMVTLVVLGDQITAFINGQLAYTALNHAGSVVYISHGLSAYNQAACEFDYFKYWDLREIDPAVKSALATIQNEQPLFQTGFDTWDFGDPQDNAKIENGKLIVTSENQQHAGLTLQNLHSDKFAVEFDVRILDSSPEGHCIFETSNNYEGGDSSFRAMSAMVFLNGQASLSHYVHPDQSPDLITGVDVFDFSTPSTVTLIFLGDQIATFVNGQIAYTVVDPAGSAVYTNQALSANYTIGCEYDNFKIWDLRGLDPATLTALAAIQSEEPLYQTSFDTWDFGNPVGNARVESGKLIVTSPGEHVSVDADTPDSDRFAVQFEVRLSEASPAGHCIFYTDGNKDDGLPMGIVTGFHMNGESNLAYVLGPDSQDDLAYSEFDASGTNKVTLVIVDDQIAAFFNERLAYAALNPLGGAVYGNSTFAASHTIKCEYDNFKYWDLSGVDFSAATTTSGTTSSFASILDSIAGKTPDYEDDFSNLESGWPTDRNSTGNEFGYQDGAYIISAKDICNGPSLPADQMFSDFVLEMDVEFINQGDGTASILYWDEAASYGANISPQGWVNFHKNVNGIHIPLLEAQVPASSFHAWDTIKHLTLIARQNQNALYVNRQLIIALTDTDTTSSQGIINFAVCSSNPLQVLIDNLKIWDITELSP